MRRLRALPTILALALGLPSALCSAQTLPQSTVDRQTIAQLQYQLSIPGVSAVQRREIDLHISQLEYQINTRPPITPPPFLQMPEPAHQSPLGFAPYAVPAATDALTAQSCAADRAVIAYLAGQLRDASATPQERSYVTGRIVELQRNLSDRNC